MKLKKGIAWLCALVLLTSVLLTGTVMELTAATAEFTVTDNGVYVMESINARPVTMEAVIKFPQQTSSGRLGILLGNWVYPQGGHVDYKIESDGNLRVEWGTASTSEKLEFTNVNVFTGEWLHIAVVADVANSKMHCYINGELVQSLTTSRTSVPLCSNPFAIGNNPRQGNGYNFRGAIKSIAVYNDIRTADEIAADMKKYSKDGLLMHFDMTGLREGATLTETVSGKEVKWEQKWFDDRKPVGEYDYSMAVIGDPQTVTKNATYADTTLPAIYNYVADNVETRKIKQVFTLGDLTDTKTGKDSEWVSITNAMDILNGVVPHNMLRGNHDEETFYDTYITTQRYGDGAVAMDGTMNSYYRLLTIDTTEYMMLTLPYAPTTAERAWASEQIAAHPKHRVIIATHSFLNTDGSKTAEGTNIWNDVAATHSNVILVLSGHMPTENITVNTTKGISGNTVTHMLVDQQDVDQPIAGGTGLIAFLYFSNNGRHVEVEYYSVLRDQYYKMTNQIEYDLDIPWDENVPAFTVDTDECVPQENSGDASVLRFENGDLAVDAWAVENGYRYTFTAQPAAGYAVAMLKITDANGNVLPLSADNNGVYTFTSAVGGKVVATFEEASAEMGEQFVFNADFTELAEMAADSAYTDGVYTPTTDDTVVNNWVNSKFGTFLNQETSYKTMTYLGQPSEDLISDSSYTGNVQWQLAENSGLGLTFQKKGGQLLRKSMTLAVKDTSGEYAELSDFEAEVVFNKAGVNSKVGGVYISFHEKYPGRASFNSSKTPTSATGDLLVVGNALESYTYQMFGDEITVLAGVHDITTEYACREAEVLTGAEWNLNNDYKLYLKVQGTTLAWSLTDLSANTVVASGTDDTPGGSGTVSVGVSGAEHILKSFKVKSLQDSKQPVNTALVVGDTVVVKVADGYELKAGSLTVTDAKGNRFVPERIGFREGGEATQYKLPVGAKAPFTVDAAFIQPGDMYGCNSGFVGTSIHEGNKGLRFVHRLAIDKDGYMLYNGERMKVDEYGLLMAAEMVLADATALNLDAAKNSPYILRFSWPQANKYYDLCETHVDIAVQVMHIGGTVNEKLNIHSRVYITFENGVTVYATPATDNYANALPEDDNEVDVDFGDIFGPAQ